MKAPELPPDLGKMNVNVGRIILNKEIERTGKVNGQYLHWDEMKRRTPPRGLSHKEWWCGVKFFRSLEPRKSPLKDKEGRLFTYTLVDPIQEILHEIDKGLGGSIGTPETLPNKENRDRYIVRSLVEEAVTSSMLEDAVITRVEAKNILQENRKPVDKHERMVVNNFLTMQQIAGKKEQKLSKQMIFEMQETLVRDTLEKADAAGRFRHADEDIHVSDQYGERLHQPPDAALLEARMAAMCAFANETESEQFLHPVLRAIILHFWMAYDHPFVDGNGRTARALFYWSMLHQGYWLVEYISISQIILKSPRKYYMAFLHTETDENDLTYFIIHQLEVIRAAIKELYKYMDDRTKRVQGLEQRLHGMRTLNHRQQSLISHALRHPGESYTIESQKIMHKVSHETARTDMFALVEKGLFETIKVGKTYRFYPKPDLEVRLER